MMVSWTLNACFRSPLLFLHTHSISLLPLGSLSVLVPLVFSLVYLPCPSRLRLDVLSLHWLQRNVSWPQFLMSFFSLQSFPSDWDQDLAKSFGVLFFPCSLASFYDTPGYPFTKFACQMGFLHGALRQPAMK